MPDSSSIQIDSKVRLRLNKLFEMWGYPDPRLYVQYDDEWVVISQSPMQSSSRIMLSFGDIHLKASIEPTGHSKVDLIEADGCVTLEINSQRVFQFVLPSSVFEPAQWDVFIRWLPNQLKSENNVLLQLREEDSTGQIDLSVVRQLVLQQCDWIETLTDFSSTGQLESLSIFNCASLNQIQSLSRAKKLRHLEIRWCGSLQWLPEFSSLTALELLRIQWCSRLEVIPNLSSHPSLKILHISACNQLGSLPALKGCHQLHTLYVSWFRTTPYFPELEELSGLRVLNLQSCSGLETLPKLSELDSLYRLNISDCQDLLTIDQLEQLPSLNVLVANGCTQLQKLVLPKQSQLNQVLLGRCVNLSIIEGLSEQKSLLNLHISGASLRSLDGLSQLNKLEQLYVSDCQPLEHLSGLNRLKSLISLQVFGCTELKDVSELSECTSLRELRLGGLRQVSSLPDLETLTSLRDLTISWFQKLEKLPSLDGLSELRTLKLGGHESLVSLERLERFPNLHALDLSRCSTLKHISGLQHLVKLNELVLNDCVSLKELEGLGGLERLRTLNLHGCKSLEKCPDLPLLTRLEHLDLGLCRALRHVPDFGGLVSLQYLDLSSRLFPTVIPLIDPKSALEEIHLENNAPVIGVSNLRQCSQLKELYFLDPIDGVDILIDVVIRREDQVVINANIDEWIQLLRLHPQPSEHMSRLITLLRLLPESADTNLLWRELIRLARRLGPHNQQPLSINSLAWKQLGEGLCVISPQNVHEPIHDLIFNLDPYFEAAIILPAVLPVFTKIDITVQAWLAELIAEQCENLPKDLHQSLLPLIVFFFVEMGYPETAKHWLRYAKHPYTTVLQKRCEAIINQSTDETRFR